MDRYLPLRVICSAPRRCAYKLRGFAALRRRRFAAAQLRRCAASPLILTVPGAVLRVKKTWFWAQEVVEKRSKMAKNGRKCIFDPIFGFYARKSTFEFLVKISIFFAILGILRVLKGQFRGRKRVILHPKTRIDTPKHPQTPPNTARGSTSMIQDQPVRID